MIHEFLTELSEKLRVRDPAEVLVGPQSCLLVPIRCRQQTVGVLGFQGRTPSECDQQTTHVLQYIADRIGIFWDRKRERTQERADAALARATRSVLALARMPMRTAAQRESIRVQLYKRLVEAAIALPRVQYAGVRVHFPISHRLHFVAGKGAERPEAAQVLMRRGGHPVDEKSAGGHVISTGKAYVFGSLEEAQHYQMVFDDVRSHASFPIRCSDQIQLILSVDSTQYYAFEKGSWVFQRLQQLAFNAESILAVLHTSREPSLREFTKVCQDATSVKDLCEKAAQALRDVMDTFDCTVFLVTPAGDEIEVAGTTGLQEGLTKECQRRYSVDTPEGCTGWVGHFRKLLLIEDLTNPNSYPNLDPPPKWLHKIPQHHDTTAPRLAFLGVPIKVGDEMLGVVRFSARQDGQAFRQDDTALAQRLAGELGISVQRIGYANRLAASHKLATVAIRGTVKETADEMAKVASELLQCDAVHIRVRQGDELRLTGYCGRALRHPQVRRIGEPFSGAVAAGPRPLVTIQDVDSDRFWAAQRKEVAPSSSVDIDAWVESMACAKLIAGDELVGTISFHSKSKDSFGVETVPILEEIARHCALLVRHSRIHEKEMALAKAALNTSRQVVAHPERVKMESVAKEVAQAFADLLPLRVSTVWLLDEAKSKLHRVAVALESGRDSAPRVSIPDHIPIDAEANVWLSKLALFSPFWGRISWSVPAGEALLASLPPGLREWCATVESYVIVPLALGKDPLGVVVCCEDTKRPIYLDEEGIKPALYFSQVSSVTLAAAGLLERQRRAMDVAAPLAMMGALLDAFLHQMAQPVNNMGWLLYNAMNLAASSPRITQKLTGLSRDVERMEATITELKTFVSGQGAYTGTNVDLAMLVREAAQKARFHQPQGIKVDVSTPDHPVWVQGVAPILSEAINLVATNAAEAMPHGGSMTFTLECADGQAHVAIHDTGIGMSEAVLLACRRCFFTTKDKGSGLGLAVVEAACNWHHGRLDITSHLGQGTTVHLHIPIKGGN